MSLFRKNLKKEHIITKYKIGESVPPNKKANKIAENVIRDVKSTKRKWF